MWLEEAAGKVELAQRKAQQCPQVLVTPMSSTPSGFLRAPLPLVQGQKLGLDGLCFLWHLQHPLLLPKEAKERVKGAKILHGNNLKGKWWMVL